MERVKFAFCGYDLFFEVVESLAQADWELSEVWLHEVDGYYNSSKFLESFAEEAGATIHSNKITDDDVRRLEQNEVAYLIVAGYGHKIPIAGQNIRVLNVHPSDLPVGRGPWPLPSLIQLDGSTGAVTLHEITDELDAGDVLLKHRFDLLPQETMESLIFKMKLATKKLIETFSKSHETAWQNRSPQSGEASYWPAPTWDERTIDFNQSIDTIEKLIRAYGKFDTVARIEGTDYIVQNAVCWKEKHELQPGIVAARTNRELCIAASDGYVALSQIRLDPDNEGEQPNWLPDKPS